jgi:hypothetical protein
MAKSTLFPVKIDDLVNDLRSKHDYLKSAQARLAIATAHMTQMTETLAAVDTAYAQTTDREKRTPLATARLHEALDNAKEIFRKHIEFYVEHNPAATPVDFEALHIPPSGGGTPLPVPEATPGIGHISSADLEITIPFFDAKNGHHAKPEGVYALETYFKIGGDEPIDISLLSEKAMTTSSPQRIRCNFDDEFKIAYLAFRWIGTRGDYGPWSSIHKISVAR